jgi:hypothetical protein
VVIANCRLKHEAIGKHLKAQLTGSKAAVRLLFNTVFDCRQKIRNKRKIKINPL